MRRCFVCVMMLASLATTGCGSANSYSARAFSEFRAGKGTDYLENKKRPDAKAVAAVEKSMKSVTAGTKEDFYQAFRILSNQRDQSDHIFQTGATSVFDRAAYKRVFGDPDTLTKESPQAWTHETSNGSVRIRGHWKVEGSPTLMKAFPLKQK